MQTSIMSKNYHVRSSSSIVMVNTLNDVIFRLHVIKVKIEIRMQNGKTQIFSKDQQQRKIDSLWNKYHTVVMQFLQQFQQQLKNIKEFSNTEIKGEDITHLLKYLELPTQNQTIIQLSKHHPQPYSHYCNFQKDTNIIKRCKQFISEQDQDEQIVGISQLIRQKSNQKHKYPVQTLQKEVQTNPFMMNYNGNSYSSNPQTNQDSNDICNEIIFKSKVFSPYQTPSPFQSHNKSQHLSSSPLKKGDKPSLPSTGRQKHSKLTNHHNVSLITLDTLLYVLKMMGYLLPVGFLMDEIQNIKICRSYMGENKFLQPSQVDWIGRTLNKLVKKMKILKKQLRKTFLTSKFIDFQQKLSIKVS